MKKKYIIIGIIVIIITILLCAFLYLKSDNYKLNHLFDNLIKENQLYNNYRYNEYDNHVGIVFYEGDEEEVFIPEVIDGKKVLSIDDSAFYGKTNIKKVTIPSSVIYIGHQTFIGDKNIEEIVLPDNILRIGEHAFDVCRSLKRIYVKKGSKTELTLKETNFYKYIYYK
ncbi:MAG: leucine-rich repeat protein [Bacilli bacterium]|nr:leucine-rich repeat protein [Bacilli bacterium]